MNSGLNLNLEKLKAAATAVSKRYGKHIGFAVIIVVLLIYVLVVLKIDSLSNAEPSPSSQAVSPSSIAPHVNQKAIDRIQALENNSPQLHALFEQARNNPFQD